MGLDASTLKGGLEALAATGDEATARARIATAYHDYVAEAEAQTTMVPVTPGSLSGAKTAMDGAMSGLSANGAAAAKIGLGMVAFWTTMAASAAAIFSGSTTITPPIGLASVDIQGVFDANVAAKKSLSDAAQALADEMDSASQGGKVVFPSPGTTEDIV